jgi:3-oxoacyl-[acyl-carrier protein] reductase
VHYHAEHDAAQPWGADDLPAVLGALESHRRKLGPPGSLADHPGDLAAPEAPERLVANHARSAPDAGLGDLTAEILNAHWAVDARSVILLVQAFAGVTETLADELADRGITLNAVNPGPVDTGHASGAAHAAIAGRFPGGLWGTHDARPG